MRTFLSVVLVSFLSLSGCTFATNANSNRTEKLYTILKDKLAGRDQVVLHVSQGAWPEFRLIKIVAPL